MSTELGKVSLAEVIRRAVEARVAELRVALPGTIQKFDKATQLAEVRPDLRELRFDEEDGEIVDSLPVISDVPCIFPGGAGFSATWPVKKGDPCLLVFTDRSLDKWLEDGGEVDPVDVRRHHLSDAVAILGVRAKPDAIPDFDGDHMTLGKDGEGSQFVALANLVKARLDSIQSTFDSHTHAAGLLVSAKPGDPVTGTTAVPSSTIGSLADVASATVKIKG